LKSSGLDDRPGIRPGMMLGEFRIVSPRSGSVNTRRHPEGRWRGDCFWQQPHPFSV